MSEVKMQDRQIIKCPHCGYEYLPGEIFYPDNAIGQPSEVVRDALGKILYEEYKEDKEPLAEEIYYCDGCGKPFITEVHPHYKTREQVAELDFSDTTSTLF